jgi:hypothetical protein
VPRRRTLAQGAFYLVFSLNVLFVNYCEKTGVRVLWRDEADNWAPIVLKVLCGGELTVDLAVTTKASQNWSSSRTST